jgi:hypothetical protein
LDIGFNTISLHLIDGYGTVIDNELKFKVC